MSDRLALDRTAAGAWPAQHSEVVDGWLLRATRTVDGEPYTSRGNSALAVEAEPGDLALVTAFYRERGLPPLVQVSDPVLDRRLATWQHRSPTLVMTGPLPRGDAGLVGPLGDDWMGSWRSHAGASPAVADLARRCLERIAAPAGYAAVQVGGETVAVGRGVVQDGWLGVFSMVVAAGHRGQGHGRAVLDALGAWGEGHNACQTYLQVEVGNTPARRLYDRAGLAEAHRYHYRRLD